MVVVAGGFGDGLVEVGHFEVVGGLVGVGAGPALEGVDVDVGPDRAGDLRGRAAALFRALASAPGGGDFGHWATALGAREGSWALDGGAFRRWRLRENQVCEM